MMTKIASDMHLVLPERVILEIRDHGDRLIPITNVLFGVHAFARRKNDFTLGPFASDSTGVVTITRSDLESDALAHYDTGVMDFDNILGCHPKVEISAFTADEITKAIEARTKIWRSLLAGERKRWSSIDELIATYRAAANARIRVEPLRVLWDGSLAEYTHTVRAEAL